jgi:hypothetical protein
MAIPWKVWAVVTVTVAVIGILPVIISHFQPTTTYSEII